MKSEPRIDFTPWFNKQREAAQLEIKQAFRDVLDLFSENPTHEALRSHPLSGKYAGFISIDVTDDWRALYRKERESIIFVDLGTHDELYGENS